MRVPALLLVEADPEAVRPRVLADPGHSPVEPERVAGQGDRAEHEGDPGPDRGRRRGLDPRPAAADVVGGAEQPLARRIVDLLDVTGHRQRDRDAAMAALDRLAGQ